MSNRRGNDSINFDELHSLKVDNLPYDASVHELRRMFDRYGDIGDVYIPRDRYNNHNRGFGFVRFYSKRDADYAVSRVDGRMLSGRELRVSIAKYGRPIDEERDRGSKRRRSRSRSPLPRRSRTRSPPRRSRSRSRSPRRRDDDSRSRSRSPLRRSRSRSLSRSRSPRLKCQKIKEIYELIYSDTPDETNAERELRRIETQRKESKRRANERMGKQKKHQKQMQLEEDENASSDSDDDSSTIVQMQGIYPLLSTKEEQPMPKIRVDRSKGDGANRRGTKLGEKEGLMDRGSANDSEHIKGAGLSKFVPKFIISRNSAESEQCKREAKQRDLEKTRAKKEESEQKLMEKKERRERKRRQMAELRERVRIERRRKNFAGAVDLLLTYCRLITSFAVLVGNIHKTFIPRYLAPPLENVYDSPDLLMFFTITLLIDVGFFWLLVFWSYCQQMALCCRLGFCRFLLWCIALVFVGGGLMLYPMHFVHEQLGLLLIL
ncbi:hypothetical protein niasHS_000543 [Heterodera schachtii]|uniref:RRM domain-containing protein n=1 Tax=Heterodera schachtii TaxID=97005 RepID=A0ABD2K526_HETSC